MSGCRATSKRSTSSSRITRAELSGTGTISPNATRALPAGEICPSYLGSDEARERIALHLPQCRIICTFRDPVQVLFSFWKLARRNAWTDADFESYVPANWSTGAGAARLARPFGSDQVLAQLYDDLLADPQSYLDRVCDFIAIKRIPIAGSLSATRAGQQLQPSAAEPLPRAQRAQVTRLAEYA